MKKITFISALLFTLLMVNIGFSQKVVIIGMNHISSGAPNDGFTFVATEAIPAGEVIYFTENEYDDVANAFTFNGASTGEAVVRYVVGAGGLATGVVVFMHETSSNTFTITCSSGNCGTSTTSTSFGNGSFNLATNGDGLYAYSDTDENATNGITQIYSAMYTGSGELPIQNGGNIPANNNPTGDYPNAVLIDGFPDDGDDFLGPDRVEYKFSPATLRDGVSQTALENPTNYLSYVSSQDLSIVPFTNLNLGGANPVLTLTSSPATLAENSGSSFTYTFMLDANATSNITVNFSVGGSATFTSDYGQTGAASFNASSGTVVITSGTNSKAITITPSGDASLEPDETVILTLNAGTGYDAGSPSIATGTIENDDTLAVTPIVAVTGGVHTVGLVEGFSFVALDDITVGTEVFFTENPFDNNLLRFSGAEGVIRWIAPAGGVLRGEVIVATEGPANVFTATCNSGSCGTITLISGNFDYASNGEGLFAYTDSDTNHTNGISAISAVLFTGTSVTPGGNIPAIEDPSSVYIGSVVVDGFSAVKPIRTEYDPTLRNVTVDQANFQNTGNWLHAQAAGTLSTVPFSNIIIATGSANPTATVTATPTSSVEDSGTGMVYTFMLDANAVGDITVNFTVTGTATYSSDYIQTGAATFNTTTGTAVILDGNNSVDVTITPVVDAVVEPLETVQLMIASGTGYDGGSPNSATGNITNDDASNSDPLVAITGMNHVTPDGFSFVAAKDIPASTLIYFTENEFDNTTLFFSSGEGVLAYTSPGTIIPAGDVIVIKETSPNVYTLTCNGDTGSSCGSIVLVSGNLAHDTLGESLYAYEDSDNDPTNGVDDIYAVMYTGTSSSSGGSIPASEDPSEIYLSALVIDGFPATAPDRTEYRFALGERDILVEVADFEDTTNNWLHGQTNADLSPIPFANISIIDIIPPVITCPADIVVDNDTGSCNAVVNFTVTATDNLPGVSVVSTPASGSVFQIGITTVTSVATDAAGNTDSCTFDVTVNDSEDPLAICTSDITVNNDAGQCDAIVTFALDANDNCPGVSFASVPVSGSVFPVGTTEVTVTATDGAGNTNVCTFDVTVEDDEDPLAICPSDIAVSNDAGQCDAIVTFTLDAADNCPGVSVTSVPTSGSVFPVGTTEVAVTATDAAGNTNVCTFDVTIEDDEDPLSICPSDITVSNDTGQCDAIVTFTLDATDNCPGVIVESVPTSGSVFPVGTTEVTVTATDGAGNTDVCTFNVIVEDGEDPLAICPADITVSSQVGLCGAIVNFTLDATDNCPGVSVASVPISGSVFPVGTTEVTVTATDGAGNSDVCTFNVIVEDDEDPLAICPLDITVSNDAGQCDAIVTFTLDATDNCPGVIVDSVPTSGSVFPVGTTEVIVTATDAAGNTDVCTFNVIVEDDEDPLAVCPADITVSNDPGQCDAIVTFTLDVVDNCPGGSVASVPVSGSVFPVGTTEVTVTATDAVGNTNVCTFDVIVEDNEDPVANCVAPFSIELDENGEASITAADIDAGSTDNCGIESLSVDPSTFTCTNAAENTVTLTVTDIHGNVSTCTTIITIEKRPTTLTYTGDLEEQYSDQVDLSATLVDVDGLLLEGKTISFTIGTQSTTGTTDINGVATARLILTQDPNVAYTVETAFIEDECYLATTDSDTFDITQENAILAYTGQSLQVTQDENSSEATIVLSANIQDITVTDFANDSFEGDIRNAMVKFVNRDSNTDISGWIPVVNLIDPSDPTTATVSYNWMVDIGNNTSKSYTVGIIVGTLDDNGYYLRDSSDDNTVITVYVPVGDFITGGGYIIPDNSAGQYASTDGLSTNFGFNVKFNPSGRKLKGHMNVIFRILQGDGIHTYQIKGNAIQSLGVNINDPGNKIAEFITKANLKDITDPNNPINLGGNLRLKVDMTDKGEPGIEDSIGLTLTTANGGLLYSSNWTGIDTAEMLLSGGNIVVHSGFSADNILGELGLDLSSVMLYPNPAKAHVILNNPNNLILEELEIFDIHGRLIRSFDLINMETEKSINISKLGSAVYFILIKGVDGQVMKKLIIE